MLKNLRSYNSLNTLQYFKAVTNKNNMNMKMNADFNQSRASSYV